MTLGISVIICTYNGALRISETIKHLALQQVSSNIPWEIIIVNNASTDNTAFIANQEWKKYCIKSADFKILEQPIPGRNNALILGVKEARFEYILACDDDNWLNPDYVNQAFKIMLSDSMIGVLGGCGIFEPEEPRNKEINDFKFYYVNGSQNWANTEHWVYGAGSIYRKSIFLSLLESGWQQITIGRTGNSLISGEDVEICFMIFLMGYKIHTDDRLTFKHFVPSKRQSSAYLQNLSFWLSYSYVFLRSYVLIINNEQRGLKNVYKEWLANNLKTAGIKIYHILIHKIKTGENPTLQKKIEMQNIFGIIYSIIINKKKISKHNMFIKEFLSKHKNASDSCYLVR